LLCRAGGKKEKEAKTVDLVPFFLPLTIAQHRKKKNTKSTKQQQLFFLPKFCKAQYSFNEPSFKRYC